MYQRDLGGSLLSTGAPGRAFRRRLALLAGAASLVAGVVMASTSPASAATATVSVSPDSNLTTGGSVTVSVTTPNATPSGVFVAVTQCGNATSSGTPLTTLASDGSDCVGASGLGSTLQLLSGTGAGAGTYQTPLKLVETGIGSANTECIAEPPATLPCQILASTASLSGAYTGTGAFSGAASITYANNTSTSTTTSASSTTTVASSTTTVASSTTTVAGGTTSTTQPHSATTTTVVSTTSTTQPHSTTTTTSESVGLGSSSATTTTTVSTGATTSVEAAATPSTTSSGDLAATGPTQWTWALGLIALGLIVLGYLAVSGTWKPGRKTPS